MLVLSLAHSSVNSLLGPLPQRGVQGCIKINQQLTRHHLRSGSGSPDLTGSQQGREKKKKPSQMGVTDEFMWEIRDNRRVGIQPEPAG